MGDLLFSAGGESVGAVVPSWRVTWCWLNDELCKNQCVSERRSIEEQQ